MTVNSAFTAQVKPGRLDDVVDLTRRTGKAAERLGAHDLRLLASTVAGEAYDTIVVTTEYPNTEALGVVFDKMATDDEIGPVLAEIRGTNTPYLSQNWTVSTEIPLGRKLNPQHGRVIDVYISRPAPGRFQAGVELGVRAFDLLERFGARNCRLWTATVAGSASESVVAVMEYENMRAWGKAQDSFGNDPAGQSLFQVTQSSDSPVIAAAHSIYSEIVL
jgi:hypothetical protein